MAYFGPADWTRRLQQIQAQSRPAAPVNQPPPSQELLNPQRQPAPSGSPLQLIPDGRGASSAVTSPAISSTRPPTPGSSPRPGVGPAMFDDRPSVRVTGGNPDTSRAAQNETSSMLGEFFTGVPDTEIYRLTNDPRLAAELFGRHRAGQTGGNRAAIANSLNEFADPEALLRAMGYNSIWLDPQQQLAKQADIWNLAMGAGSGPNYRFDRAGLIANVLNAASSLQNMNGQPTGFGLDKHLFDLSGGDMRQLPRAVNQMLAAALYNLLPQNTYQSLMFTLDRLATDYELRYMQEPQGAHPNYGDIVRQVLGGAISV